MKKIILILTILISNLEIMNAQCTQRHSNSLFPIKTFLSFTGNLDKSEAKLLSWDFCFVGKSSANKEDYIYYEYRLDHTADLNTNKYLFDRYLISNDATQFEYVTCSNKNYIAYKQKLLNYGFVEFEKLEGITFYKKETNFGDYLMWFKRDVHNTGTPNYWIYIAFKKDGF